MLFVARRRPTSPAACHVVPPASWFCSSSTTSFQPSFARWYATLQPTIPPPTMRTLLSVGSLEFTMGREFTCETFFHNAPFRGQWVRSRDVRYSLAVNLLSHLFLKAPLSALRISFGWAGI